jgi:hypothetical protein
MVRFGTNVQKNVDVRGGTAGTVTSVRNIMHALVVESTTKPFSIVSVKMGISGMVFLVWYNHNAVVANAGTIKSTNVNVPIPSTGMVRCVCSV